jgi:hypothetical protein
MGRDVSRVLWWSCLVAAPAILVVIELFHPAGFTEHPGMYQYLSKPESYDPAFKALAYWGPPWWFTLHMIQTPMVGLVAVGLVLLVHDITAADGRVATISAWLSRVAAFIFVIYYTSLDAIGGVGLGRTIELTEAFASQGKLTPDQVHGVAVVLNATWTDPWAGGVGSFISETGSWAAFLAALFAAAALLFGNRVPRLSLVLLVTFGWELQVSHTMPHGPIAFTLLILFALWIAWQPESRAAAVARGSIDG